MNNIVYLGEDTASFHLFFNGASVSDSVSLFNLTEFDKTRLNPEDINKITKANHVIFGRDINWKTLKIAKLLQQYKIPYSYYADDNYFILRRIIPSKKVDNFLAKADAIITTTEKMQNFLQIKAPKSIAKQIQLPLDVDISNKHIFKKTISNKSLNIGFLGTGKNKLYNDVFEDLANNSPSESLNIFVQSSLSKIIKKHSIPRNISIIEFSFTKNYTEFIAMAKGFELDFILQPADINDDNYRFKNLNSLLLPYHCGCLTLFCDNPPYSDIKNFGMEKLLNPNNKFSEKVKRLTANNEERISLIKALSEYVEDNFSTNNNIKELKHRLSFKTSDSKDLSAKLGKLKFSKTEKRLQKLGRSLYRRSIDVKQLIFGFNNSDNR